MKKNLLLLIIMLSLLSNLKAQTFQAGNYKILLENSRYYDITGAQKVEFNTDKILIKLKDELTTVERAAFATSNSLTLLSTTRLGISVYQKNSGTNIITLIGNLSTDSNIDYFDLNYLFDFNTTTPYTNDSYDRVWTELFVDPDFLAPYERINLFSAWNTTKGNSDVIIGNLDNGIFLNHEDLGAGPDTYTNIWTNKFEVPNNGIDDDNNGYIDDYYGWDFGYNDNDVSHNNPTGFFHGTTSAGIMAAKTNNLIGGFGIAGGWNGSGVKIMNVKTSNSQDRPEAATLPAAIEYACENGARVINMPFSVGANLTTIQNTIEYYYNYYNVIFLASAGNITGSWNNPGVFFPANIECVIAVSGSQYINGNERIWKGQGQEPGCSVPKWMTAYGPEVDISAPVNPSIQLTVEGNNSNPVAGYRFLHSTAPCYSGTSWSVAMASGVVALMLSVDPCLSADEIIEILHSTADKVGGYNYNWDANNPGHSKEFGYGRLNAATAVAACLHDIIPPINTSITWNTEKTIGSDILIENGGELNIMTGSFIRMNPYSKIIVKPGGRLIIDGGTITTACNKMWEGIEVWGNSSQHQFAYGNNQYYQGYVNLNDATISNARNAVSLWKPGDYSKTGGIVKATNSRFINNRESIRALSYRNFHPVNGSEMDYVAIIKNCVFEVNDDYFGDYEFFKHVDLANVRGPQFLGCDFSLSSGAPNVNSYNHAIAAYNAGFTVNAFCTSSTVPCTEYDRCKFAGFRYAISANPVGRTSRSFFVNKAEFENNIFGIQVNGIDNFIVVNSNFKVGSATQPFCSFGIYMEESNGFAIEENEFSKTTGTLSTNTTGIYTKSTYGEDEIYKNRFSNLTSGNYCEGFNYFKEYWTGLEFLCNQNTGNFADFYVKYDTLTKGDAIQAHQGNTLLPAANTFSPNAIWHFFNGGDNLVGYYYRNAGFEYPTRIYHVTRELVVTPPVNLCLSNYGIDNPKEKIILNDQERIEEEYRFATAAIDYANVKNLYDRLTDGGSTGNTMYKVNSATSSNMLAVKNDLLASSPHLSEEVLKLLAERTDVFPDIAVFDVLAANPDELKKTELIRFLEEKDNPLPGYMIDILRQVAEGSSYKTLLQLEMNKFSRLRTNSANAIIRSILNSECIDYTDLRNWLENLGGIEADKQIISSYMDELNYTAASNLALTLATKYNLQGEELADINAFNECLNLWIAVKTSDRQFNELTEEEIATLENIIANDSLSSAGSFAQSMITAYDSRFDYKCPEFETPELKHHEIDYRKLAEDQGFLVAVNPNPAKDWVSFDYTFPEDISSGIIEIRDLKGNLIDKLIINGTKGQIIWNAAAFPAGSYFYTAKAEKLTHSGKIVIVK